MPILSTSNARTAEYLGKDLVTRGRAWERTTIAAESALRSDWGAADQFGGRPGAVTYGVET